MRMPASLKFAVPLLLCLAFFSVGIRGVIASASLKRGIGGHPLPPRPRIRGVIASASLKQGTMQAALAAIAEVSEALLPRPH